MFITFDLDEDFWGQFLPKPHFVLKFYQVLDMVLGSIKQSIMELLKDGKDDEARSKLKDIVMKMFSDPYVIFFPPIAIVGNRLVYLDVTALAGLSRLCESIGIKIPFKFEWRVNELLELLDKVYEKTYAKFWVEILRNIIKHQLDMTYTI